MPFVTVSRGGPSGDNDIPDGTYLLELTGISDPRTVAATRGVNAGKNIDLIDWTWVIDAPNTAYHDREVVSSTSKASGPKSKMYGYLTALMGGAAPAPETPFEKDQLIGRHVLGTVSHDEDGWNRLGSLVAVPAAMLQQQFAQATGLPATAPVVAAAPVAVAPAVAVVAAAPAAQPAGDLPF